jgi:sulfofructose kinase
LSYSASCGLWWAGEGATIRIGQDDSGDAGAASSPEMSSDMATFRTATPPPRAWDVVGFGENSVDVIATLDRLPALNGKAALDDLATLSGGQVSTAMLGCARLGLRARYVGSFGDDATAAWQQAQLAAEGVDLSARRVVAGPSRTAIILVETSTGTRTVLGHRPASITWPPAEMPVEAFTSARALLVDATDLEASVAACQAARAAEVMTVVDVDDHVPGLDRLLRVCDIVVASDAFAGDLRHLHRDSGARVVIATLGAHGAITWDGEREYHSPGFAVPVTDTTGAGDAFRAGLIASMLDFGTRGLRDPGTAGLRHSGTPGLRDLDFANAAAALNCRGRGAQAGLPTRAEVDALVTLADARRSKETWGRDHMESQPEASGPGDPHA